MYRGVVPGDRSPGFRVGSVQSNETIETDLANYTDMNVNEIKKRTVNS